MAPLLGGPDRSMKRPFGGPLGPSVPPSWLNPDADPASVRALNIAVRVVRSSISDSSSSTAPIQQAALQRVHVSAIEAARDHQGEQRKQDRARDDGRRLLLRPAGRRSAVE